jgi:pimeloyl-ACP methyl ester carboxylesterase
MAKITSPLLVLAGDVDIVTKPEAGQVIALSHPNGKYVGIDGVNHMGFLELSPTYNKAIAEFARQSHQVAPVIV